MSVTNVNEKKTKKQISSQFVLRSFLISQKRQDDQPSPEINLGYWN